MTTVVYHKGQLFADTQLTNIETGEISKIDDKIYIEKKAVVVGAGYSTLISLFHESKFRRMLKYLNYFPVIDTSEELEIRHNCDVIVVDKKMIDIHAVKVRWKWKFLYLIQSSRYTSFDFKKKITFSIGSGSSEEVNNIAEKKSPEDAIAYASTVDKYTNFVYTTINLLEHFGVN